MFKSSSYLSIYRWLMQTLTPVLKYHLKQRLKRGKEDPARLYERFGGASFSRPSGKVVWFHGASVGESISILKLIDQLLERQPTLNILVTTGTITSANLLAKHLPKQCIHQFIPLDVPKWIDRFLTHWQPNLVIFIESEFWPNILNGVKKRQIPLLLLNARMSTRSFTHWKRIPKTIKKILNLFDICFTPSEQVATYLKHLGARKIILSCNLKFTADTLGYQQDELIRLQNICEKRVVWAAISTHPGEEEIIIATHIALKKQFSNLLTILAPRHPERAASIAEKITHTGLTTLRHSENMYPRQKTDIWMVDTIGDLGLVYSLAKICFVGGSFVPIGGHNPIEAFKLGCAVIVGPHTANFIDVNQALNTALIQVPSVDGLQEKLAYFLANPEKSQKLALRGQEIINQQQQELSTLAGDILSYLP